MIELKSATKDSPRLTAIQARDGKSNINPPKYSVAIGNSVPVASL